MSTTTGQSRESDSDELYNTSTNPNANKSASGIKCVNAHEGSAITKLTEPLNEDNWMAWRERMRRILRLCGVEGYAEGKIGKPGDTEGAEIWNFNDNYAQVIIMNNILSTETVHVDQCETAKAMWDNLDAVHESKGHQTIYSIIRIYFTQKLMMIQISANILTN
jgi:gag-polypeptide of LTR copia-type